MNLFKHLRRDFSQWSLFSMTIALFISIPLFAILFYLLKGTGDMWSHIVEHFLFGYLRNSILLLVGTGILTITIGVSTAWIVANHSFKFKTIIEYLLLLPLAIPSYIASYSYVGLLGNGGSLIQLLNGFGLSIKKIDMMNIYGLIWVLSFTLYPYIYISTKAFFMAMPRSLKDTSDLLRLSNRQYVTKVAIPLAIPSIIAGLFLVFMEVLNDYGAAKYYGVNTFTTGIFRSWTALEDLQSAVFLSAILVLVVFLLGIFTNLFRGRKSYELKLEKNLRSRELLGLPKRKRFIYSFILAIPIFFGFLLPITQLLIWASARLNSFNEDLLSVMLQSFTVAFTSALIVLFFTILLVYFFRWNSIKPIQLFKRLATIGYVIPGAIIGIGMIRSSQGIIDFFENSFNLKVGYLFYGSSFILIYAYLFRFLAVAYNPFEANSLKIGEKLSEASRLLKKSELSTLTNVELPLLKPTIIGTFLLVFIDVMKELPITLLLKPYNLETLAVSAYVYADDERLSDASIPALLLVFIISLTIIIVEQLRSKMQAR